jgi:predicted Zn-dependent protease with MMP-like domain
MFYRDGLGADLGHAASTWGASRRIGERDCPGAMIYPESMTNHFLPGRNVAGAREPSRLSDEDFEALVERSEALARDLGPERRELTAFEQLVADAIDRMPPEFAEVIDHVPVVVSDRGAEIHAYGEYYGATIARDRAAHRIVIFQDTLERDFGSDPDLLARQVERTLRHEVAHHLGSREPGVAALGL